MSLTLSPSKLKSVAFAAFLLSLVVPIIANPITGRDRLLCRCISLPDDTSAQAQVIQISASPRKSPNSRNSCSTFVQQIEQSRASHGHIDARNLAAALEQSTSLQGSDNIIGMLQFLSPIPRELQSELGPAGQRSEGASMKEGSVDDGSSEGSVVICRAVANDQARRQIKARKMEVLVRAVMLVSLLAICAAAVGRAVARSVRCCFSHRQRAVIALTTERPRWMSSATLSDIKIAFEDADEDYKASVL